MAVSAGTPIELVNNVYDKLAASVAIGRDRLGRPLTLTEKILINHLSMPKTQEMERGRSYATSHQTELPCRMQLRRWHCCNL